MGGPTEITSAILRPLGDVAGFQHFLKRCGYKALDAEGAIIGTIYHIQLVAIFSLEQAHAFILARPEQMFGRAETDNHGDMIAPL